MIEDYIDGDKFENLCDIKFKECCNTQTEVGRHYVLYSETDHYLDAIRYIKENSQSTFVLVTHNSDNPVFGCNIPDNLIHWYAQNLCFDHMRVSAIPIGLERDQWYPEKKQKFFDAYPCSSRKLKAFCQFSTVTYRKEREPLLKLVLSGQISADYFNGRNGVEFDQYLNNLTRYKFCLAPRGNGIDTHRIWEALYMGCIPVVRRHTTHKFAEGRLPIYWVEEWEDFNPRLDPIGNFHSELLTMEYWRKRICQSI